MTLYELIFKKKTLTRCEHLLLQNGWSGPLLALVWEDWRGLAWTGLEEDGGEVRTEN